MRRTVFMAAVVVALGAASLPVAALADTDLVSGSQASAVEFAPDPGTSDGAETDDDRNLSVKIPDGSGGYTITIRSPDGRLVKVVTLETNVDDARGPNKLTESDVVKNVTTTSYSDDQTLVETVIVEDHNTSTVVTKSTSEDGKITRDTDGPAGRWSEVLDYRRRTVSLTASSGATYTGSDVELIEDTPHFVWQLKEALGAEVPTAHQAQILEDVRGLADPEAATGFSLDELSGGAGTVVVRSSISASGDVTSFVADGGGVFTVTTVDDGGRVVGSSLVSPVVDGDGTLRFSVYNRDTNVTTTSFVNAEGDVGEVTFRYHNTGVTVSEAHNGDGTIDRETRSVDGVERIEHFSAGLNVFAVTSASGKYHERWDAVKVAGTDFYRGEYREALDAPVRTLRQMRIIREVEQVLYPESAGGPGRSAASSDDCGNSLSCTDDPSVCSNCGGEQFGGGVQGQPGELVNRTDSDGDGVPNVDDRDRDGDGVPNAIDVAPDDSSRNDVDENRNGIPDSRERGGGDDGGGETSSDGGSSSRGDSGDSDGGDNDDGVTENPHTK